jgi:hypothetical protein
MLKCRNKEVPSENTVYKTKHNTIRLDVNYLKGEKEE